MSLLYNEKNEISKSYLKLEIYKSQICQSIKAPLPYGLCILFDDFPEKYIEPITNENEVFKSSENKFIYYLNENDISQNKLFEKEFIINSYTTSIFIIKKNFASVKIPILYSKKDNKKQWFFLKDINDNICIKILISIEIYLENKIINNFKSNNSKNILKRNSETIKENKMYDKISNNNNLNNINYYNKKIINKSLVNNHNNTCIVTTNYNSNSGNSQLNITNNIYMKTINNNSNNINNLNITFPFNFSPIPIFGKSNSFFIETIKEKDNNKVHINQNSFKSLIDKKSKDTENKDLKLISENDGDSITINDNDNSDEIKTEIKNDILNNKEDLFDKINTLILKKKEEIKNNQQIYTDNYNNYLKEKKIIVKNGKILEKENEKIKNNIKIIEKSKQIYETKALNLNEYIMDFSKTLNRDVIQNELYEYERTIMENLNNISFAFNNIEYLKNQTKKRIYNKINNNKSMNKKKSHNSLYFHNKNKINNPIIAKKLNFENKSNRKIGKELYSNREINSFNTKNSPIYKLKEFNSKLSLSIPNSEKRNDEKKDNNNIDENNKTIKNYINKKKSNDNNFTKYNNKLRDYYYDTLDKKEYKKKASKSNLIKGKLKLKIPFNENSANNIETKYILTKNNFNKEFFSIKTNSINTNNISNKSINIKNKGKNKKISNLNSEKMKSDKFLFKNKCINNNYKKSYTIIDKKFISIENKSLNSTVHCKLSIDNNNLCKKKLNKKEKIKYDKKSFNNETLKNLNNYNNNYFKGKPILISNNNNSLGNESFLKNNFIDTETDLNKKTIDNCSKTNLNNNKIIRRKTKNNTVKLKSNINGNESCKKKNVNFRKSLNTKGDIVILNIEKQNKQIIRDNEQNNNSKNIALTHIYAKPIGININSNYNDINKKNFIKNKNKDK